MKIFHAIKFWGVWSLAIGLWVVDPFLSMRYYEVTARLDFYPVNADSIGIPILGAFSIAIGGLPFWFSFCRKAFRQLSEPLKLFRWEPTKMWRPIGITLAFCLCIFLNIQSARHYYGLIYLMEKSEFSHLSELAVYLLISSIGWAILWMILGSCFIAGIKAGKEDVVHSNTKVSPLMIVGWLAAFILASKVGADIWRRTVVMSKDELQALSKEGEFAGTWHLDMTEFSSKDIPMELFREFRVILHQDGSFAAEGVPAGIFFNKSGDNAAFSGTWRLTYHNDYRLRFSVNDVQGRWSGIQGQLLLKNGQFLIGVGNQNHSVNMVRTSPSTDG